MEFRRRLFMIQLGAVATCASALAQAQQPPIKIYVGNAPGGISDTVARLMAEHMAPALGRTMVVENKPGAGGNIAAEFVARAPVDGNSILVIYNSHPSIPALYPNLSFDLIKDLRSVGFVLGTPYLIVARPGLPGRNLTEALDQARRSGTPLTFASPGTGSPQHLMAAQLGIRTGVPITVVHYKGVAPGQADVMAGHVDFTISSVSIGLPQVQAGKLKVLAVTAAERLKQLPNDATVKELGITGFVEQGWIAAVMPAKTPDAVVKRYNEELNRMLAKPEVKSRLETMGAVPLPGTPESLDRTIQDETVLWSKLIKDLGLKGE